MRHVQPTTYHASEWERGPWRHFQDFTWPAPHHRSLTSLTGIKALILTLAHLYPFIHLISRATLTGYTYRKVFTLYTKCTRDVHRSMAACAPSKVGPVLNAQTHIHTRTHTYTTEKLRPFTRTLRNQDEAFNQCTLPSSQTFGQGEGGR